MNGRIKQADLGIRVNFVAVRPRLLEESDTIEDRSAACAFGFPAFELVLIPRESH
jgi:hypothetical protein